MLCKHKTEIIKGLKRGKQNLFSDMALRGENKTEPTLRPLSQILCLCTTYSQFS